MVQILFNVKEMSETSIGLFVRIKILNFCRSGGLYSHSILNFKDSHKERPLRGKIFAV